MTITTRLETIDTERAKALIASNYQHNRRVSETHVNYLVHQINSGLWKFNGESVVISKQGKLIDGQHRMHAVIKSGKPIQTMVVFGVDESSFDTMGQAKSRSVSDVIDVANATDVATVLRLIYNETHFGTVFRGTVDGKQLTPSYANEFLQKHLGIIESASFSSGRASKVRQFVPRSVLTYVHYRAGLIDVKSRDDFVDKFLTGAGLNIKSPILALRNALTPVDAKSKIPKYRIFTYVIKAFNLHYDGKSCSRIVIRDGEEFPRWAKQLPK
jgi:hypothetical protein